ADPRRAAGSGPGGRGAGGRRRDRPADVQHLHGRADHHRPGGREALLGLGRIWGSRVIAARPSETQPAKENHMSDLPIPTMSEVTAATSALHRLYSTLEAGRAVQYEAPPNLHSDRQPGEPANPTADVALDPRRMQLRLAVLKAERLLRNAAPAIARAEAELASALDAWAGHTDGGS